jgi:hypothetical protein
MDIGTGDPNPANTSTNQPEGFVGLGGKGTADLSTPRSGRDDNSVV